MEMFLYDNSIEFLYNKNNESEAIEDFDKIKSDIEKHKLNRKPMKAEYNIFYWDIINIILNKMTIKSIDENGVSHFVSRNANDDFIKDMIISLSNFPKKIYVALNKTTIKFIIGLEIKRDELANYLDIDDDYYTNDFFNVNLSYKQFCSDKYEKNNISLKLVEKGNY